MLKYFFFMSKLSGRAQWAVVIGGYIGYRVLGDVSRKNPSLSPYITPFLWAYVLFALMTWLAHPLFDLILRFNRFGRLALSPQQIAASNALALCLGPALAALAGWLFTRDGDFLWVAAFFGILCLPVAGTCRCPEGWPRNVMSAYTGALIVAGLAFFAGAGAADLLGMKVPFLGTLLMIFVVGSALSQWVVNALGMLRVRS